MRRMRLFLAAAYAALLLPLAAAAADPFRRTSIFRTASGRKGSPSDRLTPSTSGRSRPAPSSAAISAPARCRQACRPRAERAAIGVAVDRRDRLFVAGGPTGHGYVYDANTGDTIADYKFTDAAAFINDVVVTRTAAWFTDSLNAFLYRVPIAADGTLGDRPRCRSRATSSTSPVST